MSSHKPLFKQKQGRNPLHSCMHNAHSGRAATRRAGLRAQVTDALNSGALSPPDIPYDMMRALLRSPAIMAELRSFVASGSGVRPAAPCVPHLPCISSISAAHSKQRMYSWRVNVQDPRLALHCIITSTDAVF